MPKTETGIVAWTPLHVPELCTSTSTVNLCLCGLQAMIVLLGQVVSFGPLRHLFRTSPEIDSAAG